MKLLLEGKVGIDFVTYVHPIMNWRKCLNLFPSVTVKTAAITGLTRPAVLREHIAAGKTLNRWGEEASPTLLLHRCHPWAEATGFELAKYSAVGMLLKAMQVVLTRVRFENKSQLIPLLFLLHTSYPQSYSNFLASPLQWACCHQYFELQSLLHGHGFIHSLFNFYNINGSLRGFPHLNLLLCQAN